MKRLPWGYRLVRGTVTVDEERSERLRAFLARYLEGASLREARLAAGVPLCEKTCRRIFTDPAYLGLGGWPPILDREQAAQAERMAQQRGARLIGRDLPRARPLSVPTSFVLEEDGEADGIVEEQDRQDPEAWAARLYARILPAPPGDRER